MADEVRKPFPEINSLRGFVQNELRRRRTSYPVISSPFARFISCKEDSNDLNLSTNYRYFSLGLHGYQNTSTNLFDLVYGGDRELVGYGYVENPAKNKTEQNHYIQKQIFADQLTFDPTLLETFTTQQRTNAEGIVQDVQQQQRQVIGRGVHPAPGIIDITINKRAMGAPIIASVKWVCYNKQQLEFLRHHFMVIGSFVVLEWGNTFVDTSGGESRVIPVYPLNFSHKNIDDEIVEIYKRGRSYIIDRYVKPSSGNYDLMVGVIGNFKIDFDAMNNVYTVMTQVFSAGEYLWGIRNDMTSIKAPDDTSVEDGTITTIHDFFKDDSAFTGLITNKEALETGNVLFFKKNYHGRTVGAKASEAIRIGASKGIEDKELTDLDSKTGLYGFDRTFITFGYFLDVVLRYAAELTLPKQSAQELIRTLPTSNDENLAGFSEKLKSTDPEKMLIYNTYILSTSIQRADNLSTRYILLRGEDGTVRSRAVINEFKPGNNSQNNGPSRASLNGGVWLNTGMIKRVFQNSLTLEQALRTILIEMNIASGNFWNLMLFFDDDLGRFRIVDGNGGTLDGITKNKFYVFNQGVTGEATNIQFDSAFPSELTTQMALVASFKSSDKEKRGELIKKFPLIGTTSHFAFALNWTNLTDIIGSKIRSGKSGSYLQGPQSFSSSDTTDTEKRAINSLTDVSQRVAPVTNIANSSAGSALGEPTKKESPQLTELSAAEVGKINIDKETLDVYVRVRQYEKFIQKAASEFGVDPRVIRAVIAQESRGFNRSQRPEIRKDNYGNPIEKTRSIGLMQMTIDTGKGVADSLNIDFDANRLYDPEYNIRLGTAYLAQLARSAFRKYPKADYRDIVSMYNAGPGRGGRRLFDRTMGTLCLEFDSNGDCAKRGPYLVKAGEFYNKEYTAGVQRYMSKFAIIEAQDRNTTVDTDKIFLEGISSEEIITSIDTAVDDSKKEKERKEQLKLKFENFLISDLVHLNPSKMRREIIQEGAAKTPPQNNFIAPFPTTAKIEITTNGISGISISDSFLVDKLPFIYEEYGCFQTTQVTDNITPDSGWVTRIRGIFKLLWFEGQPR